MICPKCLEIKPHRHQSYYDPKTGLRMESIQFFEEDPSGLTSDTPGAKLDSGKNQAGLVLGGFARSLNEVSKVGTFGANKYSMNGWMSVPNGVNRYTDAMLRHFLKEFQGEETDPDSELLHAAHLAWNALARLDLIIREREAKK